MEVNKYENQVLSQLHPLIRKFVKAISTNKKCCSVVNIEVVKIFSSSKEQKHGNHFILSIPYAGQFLQWEIIFNSDDLTFAPDFIFVNDNFLEELDLEVISKSVPSWISWDYNNVDALCDVILELIELYKHFQIDLLENDSRLSFEYSSLISEAEIKKENIEVFVDKSIKAVRFLITLDIDFAPLTPVLKTLDARDEKLVAILIVTLQQRADTSDVKPHLYLSVNIEELLGGEANKHIPSFPPQSCLMDYVPGVQKLLEAKLALVVDNFKKKQKYIEQLLISYTTNVLEYDSLSFSKATLLFKSNFHWLLVISITNNFPRDKPKWMLRSVYYLNSGQTVTEVLNDYPYSPRWQPEEMITRAFKYAVDKVDLFQTKSMPK